MMQENNFNPDWASVKHQTVDSHSFLVRFLLQQRQLSLSCPSIPSLSQQDIFKLSSLLEQSSFVLQRPKQYDLLPFEIRLSFLNKLRAWIGNSHILKRVQMFQDSPSTTQRSFNEEDYSEFIRLKRQNSMKMQRQNLICKLFLKQQFKKNILLKKGIQKPKRTLPVVPDFESVCNPQINNNILQRSQSFSINNHTIASSLSPPVNNPLQLPSEYLNRQNKYTTLLDEQIDAEFHSFSDSTAISDSSNHPQIAQFRYINANSKANSINVVSRCFQPIIITDSIEKVEKIEDKDNNLMPSLSISTTRMSCVINKSMQSRIDKFEESLLSIIGELQLERDANAELFQMAMKMFLCLIKKNVYFRMHDLSIICNALILHASKACNRVLNIKSLTRKFPEKEKALKSTYNRLSSPLSNFHKLCTASPQEKIKCITSFLRLEENQDLILSASQYLFTNMAVHGLFNAQPTNVLATALVFFASKFNGIIYSLKEFASALQVDHISLQSSVTALHSNSKALLNNTILFKYPISHQETFNISSIQ